MVSKKFNRAISLLLSLTLLSEPLFAATRDGEVPPQGGILSSEPATEAPDQIDQQLGIYSYALNHMTPNTPPPLQNNDVLLMGSVFRRKINKDGTFLDTSLADLNVDLPKVYIQNAATELSWVFNAKEKELVIYYVKTDSKTEKKYSEDAVVYKNIILTSPIVSDGNYVSFATPDGLHSIILAQFIKAAFVAAVPAPCVMPVLPGTKIANLNVLEITVDAHPIVVRPGDGGRADRHEGSDLEATIQTQDGKTTNVRFGKRELADNISLFQGIYLELLQAANPDMQNMNVVEKIIGQNALDFKKFHDHQMAVLDQLPRDDQDMMLKAIAASGQILEYDTVGKLLQKNGSGHNTYQALANLPRNTFSSDPSPSGEWAKANQAIKVGQEINAKYGLEKSWGEVLVQSFKNQTPQELEAQAQEEARLKSSFVARINKAVKDYATPERMRKTGIVVGSIAGMSALIGGVHVLDQSMGGAITQWMTASILHITDVSSKLPLMGFLKDMSAEKFFTHAPLLHYLTQPVYESIKWIDSWYKIGMVSVGLAFTTAFLPAAFFAAGLAAKAARKSWNQSKALANYGNKIYVTLNYSYQKGLLALARSDRENLYKVFDVNAYPQDYRQIRKTANPFVSRSERLAAVQPENLSNAIKSKMVADARARLIALDIVSKASEKIPGGEIDLATLQMLGEGVSVERIANLRTNSVDLNLWQTLTLVAIKELTDLSDYGSGPIDPNTVRDYELAYLKVYEKFQNIRERESAQGLQRKIYKLQDALSFCYQTSKRFMSHNVLNFTLFGLRGYKESMKFKSAEVSDKDSKIAMAPLLMDYPASNLYYAAIAPQAFGAIFKEDGARIIGDDLAQIGIMAATVPADVLSSSDPQAGALKNPSPPITDVTMAEYSSRTQTMGEAFKAIYEEWKREGQMGFAENQARTQMNNVHGIQVRMGLDYVTRLFGKAIQEHGVSTALAAKVVGLSAIYLFNKASILYSAAGFAIGYAIVWPPIFMAMRLYGNSASKNKAEVLEAHFNIVTGMKLNDLNQVQQGIAAFQEMYRRDGKTVVPSGLMKDPKEFTSTDDIANFHNFAKGNVPLPTEPSKAMTFALNIGIGTVTSTILANILSVTLYGGNLGPVDLVYTIASFIGSQIAFKSLSPLEKKAQEKAREWSEKPGTSPIARCSETMRLLFKK